MTLWAAALCGILLGCVLAPVVGRRLQRRSVDYPPPAPVALRSVRLADLADDGPWDGDDVAASPWGRRVLADSLAGWRAGGCEGIDRSLA